MRPELDIYEKIDLYLEGKLSGSTLHEFENQLQTDSSLQSKLAAVKLTNELVINHQLLALKARMQKEMKDIPFEPTKTNKKLKIAGVVGLISMTMVACYWWLGINAPITATKQYIVKNTNAINNQGSLKAQPTPAIATSTTQPSIERASPEAPSVQTPMLTQMEHHIENTNTSLEPAISPLKTAQPPLHNSSDVNPCAGIILQSDIKTNPTCIENATGEISFEDLKNGKTPYQFSINNGTAFTKNAHFTHLQAGEYKLSLKDALGCQTILPSVHITTKECLKEITNFAFNPQYHETFPFPFKEGQTGSIQIYTRTGTLIYEAKLADAAGWDGTQTNGSIATAGLYKYLIEFTDGTIKKGTVTIYE
jgi:hypothetical protein